MYALINYSPEKFTTEKAKRVFNACCYAGKFELARKIEYKYTKPIKIDFIMALGASLKQCLPS